MPLQLRSGRCLLALLIAATSIGSTGCVGMLAQIGWVAGGNKEPAEYAGLEGKKVAVVCISEASEFDRGEEATMLGVGVERLLKINVKDVEVIDQEKVADWTDKNDNWREIKFPEIGKGLGADMVVGITLHRYSLTEGSTLFKGRSHYSVQVHNVASGDVVFRRGDQMHEFPLHGARAGDSTNRKAFQRSYIALLSERIARMFYRYEFGSDIALDAAG